MKYSSTFGICLASVLLVLTVVLSANRSAVAQLPATGPETRNATLVTPKTQAAIDRGLAWLVARQHPDGSYGSGTTYHRNVAVTALCGLAFLSSGSSEGRGPHAKSVEAVTRELIAAAKPSGYILHEDSASHGPMYGHGFATLYLAETYGMTAQPKIRDTLKNATNLIINSQNPEGGWRYDPDGKDADISVTVCQIMALRAARNAGIAVPGSTVNRCIEYVKRCQNTDGGFRYRLQPPPQSLFPRSAAGVVALYSAGLYDSPEITRGLDYITRFRPPSDFLQYDSHYYYGHYYASQAMWQAGGEYWNRWYPQARDELLARQLPDGGWPDSMICSEYGTAMALIVLQIPNNYLPIFQR